MGTRNYRARPPCVATARNGRPKLKRTRIEVISVNRRVVSRSSSDAQEGFDDTDIAALLEPLGDSVSAVEELRHEMIEGETEILRPPFQPLRLRLSRVREWFSHRFKTKRSKP